MTMSERIDAAGEAARKVIQRGGQYAYTEVGQAAIAAAFPELLDGTAWLAPMDPSDGMISSAFRAVYALDESEDVYKIFNAMRDAHLSPETDAKMEG